MLGWLLRIRLNFRVLWNEKHSYYPCNHEQDESEYEHRDDYLVHGRERAFELMIMPSNIWMSLISAENRVRDG